ncbi:branched-chain amino acid transporter permease [Acetobacterium malicum]|uniref:Branched-chain amino acid transporter AzlD n=1 Tax=Acetobacterium malicum TaxID=52692 RepID=A0ABR6YTB8_9FIRM|nr:AzlD domain-containing protein [Acetobacterium malicum]MBC3898429.1 branched-chain amino acid transporter AzlD [Acetobacterium malicum]
MSINWINTLEALLVVALVTILTRSLPFLFFGGRKELPDTVSYLGTVLPAAIMIILVVFCLRNIGLSAYPFGLPELLSVAVVIIVHRTRKNVFLSISAGTGLYMVLTRTLFITAS